MLKISLPGVEVGDQSLGAGDPQGKEFNGLGVKTVGQGFDGLGHRFRGRAAAHRREL